MVAVAHPNTVSPVLHAVPALGGQTTLHDILQRLENVQRSVATLAEKSDSEAREIRRISRTIEGMSTQLDEFGKKLDMKFGKLDTIVDELCTKVDTVGTKVDKIGTKVDTIGTKVDALGTKFDKIATQLDYLLSITHPTAFTLAELTHWQLSPELSLLDLKTAKAAQLDELATSLHIAPYPVQGTRPTKLQAVIDWLSNEVVESGEV